MLSATSTSWAPWYVIPANRKWFARICAAAVLAHTLIGIDPQYPEVTADLLVVKGELEAQAPKGTPADPYAAKKAKEEAKKACWARMGERAAGEETEARAGASLPRCTAPICRSSWSPLRWCPCPTRQPRLIRLVLTLAALLILVRAAPSPVGLGPTTAHSGPRQAPRRAGSP